MNTAVVEVMAEVGIDLASAAPRRLTADPARSADAVVTMGCGDVCQVVVSTRLGPTVIGAP